MEDRIIRLESNQALLERTVEQLNEVITSQQRQIDRLEQEVHLLAERVKTLTPANDGQTQDDPPPPHYQSIGE